MKKYNVVIVLYFCAPAQNTFAREIV